MQSCIHRIVFVNRNLQLLWFVLTAFFHLIHRYFTKYSRWKKKNPKKRGDVLHTTLQCAVQWCFEEEVGGEISDNGNMLTIFLVIIWIRDRGPLWYKRIENPSQLVWVSSYHITTTSLRYEKRPICRTCWRPSHHIEPQH